MNSNWLRCSRQIHHGGAEDTEISEPLRSPRLGVHRPLHKTGVPVQAGIHQSAPETAEEWIPACAGKLIWRRVETMHPIGCAAASKFHHGGTEDMEVLNRARSVRSVSPWF